MQDFLKNEKNKKWFFNFLKKSLKNFSLIRDALWYLGSWRKSNLVDWVNNRDPDIIFFLGGNYMFSHRISREISSIINKPLVFYLTDDYIIYPNKNKIHDYILNKLLRRSYTLTLEKSCLNYAIGNLMAKEYEKEFKKKFKYIMNSVPYSEMKKIDFSKKINILKVAYFGGLHLNRWKMLSRLAQVCKNIKIDVYSMSTLTMEIKSDFHASGIQFMGGISPDQLRFTMEKYDALLHVESDDIKSRSLTRLSISTKIPEYLITGIPLLGFGPLEVASMKILEEEKIGTVVDSSLSNEVIGEKITNFVSKYKDQCSVVISAHSFAKNNFMSEDVSSKVRLDFEKILEKRKVNV